ncbi:MAG: tRNA (guanosine(46)-N7)-methyltransferase TrmB [Verrucomicrobia bacterium]|nr:tRNA (guanosine(46)-N7)-methyltransferase TrmB [Verrucomicrobiota bacterium]
MPEPSDSLLYRPPSFVDPLDLRKLFAVARPLEVELGSGDGSWIVQSAAAQPDRNFLGIERLLGRLRKIDKRGRRLGLANLRGLRIEAGYFLEYLLPPASCAALHIYFPDPWPKVRHKKNRLIGERFPALAARVLQPGGRVHLRTDHADYFEQMQSVFAAANFFSVEETPAGLAAVITDFEREFNAQGIPTLRASYRLASP